MDNQSISSIVGIMCLAFAAIGTFLVIPDRELSGKERFGIHTIFWAFVIYALWIICQLVWNDHRWTIYDKLFYISVPLLLGLLLSLLSELVSKRPPIEVDDLRLNRIVARTWNSLPNNVKRGLQNTIMRVQGVAGWSELDKNVFKNGGLTAAMWYPILPFPAKGIIHISVDDCSRLSDTAVAEALAGEFGHAYQSTRTPFDTEAIEKAGDILPAKWGFRKKAAVLKMGGASGSRLAA